MSPCIIKDVICWSQAEGTVLLIPLVLEPAFRRSEGWAIAQSLSDE
jgi:hypothetical protein